MDSDLRRRNRRKFAEGTARGVGGPANIFRDWSRNRLPTKTTRVIPRKRVSMLRSLCNSLAQCFRPFWPTWIRMSRSLIGILAKACPRSNRLSFEILESRQLLTGSSVIGNVLTVDGGTGNDVILVSRSGLSITADVNGTQDTFSVATFQKILVRGNAGNDTITVGTGVPG